MNPNVTYNSYGPPGSGSYQQQQVTVSGNAIYSVDAAPYSRRQDMRTSCLSYASTTTPSWVNPSTMLETQAQSTPVLRGSRPLPDPSHYHGRSGNQTGSMYGGAYGKRPWSGGYVIANVKEEEEGEEEEYQEGREGDGRGDALGHGEEYVGYHGETMGYSMPVGMGIGVPMERVPARGTRPLPIPGASQPLSGSSEKRKGSFVGGFWVGLRRLPKRVLRYGSRKTEVMSPQREQEREEEHREQEQQEQQEHREHSEQEPSEQEPSEREQPEQGGQPEREQSDQLEQSKQEHDHSGETHSEHHHSPETAHIPPATDYIKMTTSCTMPSSFTNDPSFTTELNPLSRCLHALFRLPWMSDRSTVDYSPLAGFGTKSGGRGVLKKQGTSWYRRPDPNGGAITGHSLDLLAAEGDGASVSAWRRRVAKRRYHHHHHHHHRRHRHEHRRYRHRSASTITFEERRQPMPFAYFPAFSGPGDPTTAEMPGEAGRPAGGRVLYMPMMPYI